MSYYPILSAPSCTGWTTLCNFAPNNWESKGERVRHAVLSWTDGAQWNHRDLGLLAAGAARVFTAADVAQLVPPDALPLLSLREHLPPASTPELPAGGTPASVVPAWRATLGLASGHTQTSYQGEVDPFPPTGTLLTFCPFLQVAEGVRNFMLLLNVEKAAQHRPCNVDIGSADRPEAIRGRFPVVSNAVNVIPMDGMGFTEEELPLVICRGLAGVPLYLSVTEDGRSMSMEHTHPPASLVIHGKRFEAQRLLKNFWFPRVPK